MKSVEYADFWSRLFAYLIDCIIIFLLTVIFVYAIGVIIALLVAFFSMPYNHGDAKPYYKLINGFVALMYFCFMEISEKQGTFGKMILGIRTVDTWGNKTLEIWDGLWRAVVKTLLPVGIIFMFWQKRKQALHDLLAGSIVIKK
jgi:uncharacterized RDD family membrane protein YckC